MKTRSLALSILAIGAGLTIFQNCGQMKAERNTAELSSSTSVEESLKTVQQNAAASLATAGNTQSGLQNALRHFSFCCNRCRCWT